jgi:hypothetical protein
MVLDLSSVCLMTTTTTASREFLALDVLAPLSWAERATIESGRQITVQSAAYRRFVSVTDDGYSAATNRTYFDLAVVAGPVA